MEHLEKLQNILQAEPFLIEQDINESVKLSELRGWDSFKHVSFIIQLELEFGIDIDTEDSAELDLISNILKKLA